MNKNIVSSRAGHRANTSLLHKTMIHYVICIFVLFALAAPVFYLLTKNYYAEDMSDLVRAIKAGRTIPTSDLEADVLTGIMLQYLLITTLFVIGVVLTLRIISKYYCPLNIFG